MSTKWRKLWGCHLRKKNTRYFRREDIASVAEIAKSNTKTSIIGSSKVQDSFRGAGVVQDSLSNEMLSNNPTRQDPVKGKEFESKPEFTCKRTDQVIRDTSPMEEAYCVFNLGISWGENWVK